MTIATIRKKLHEYLEIADDKKIKAMYTLLESEIAEHDYSDEFIATLEERDNYYKKGGKMVGAVDADKKINATLDKLRKK